MKTMTTCLLALLVSLSVGSAKAFDKPQAAYPLVYKKVKNPGSLVVKPKTTKEPAKVYPSGDYMEGLLLNQPKVAAKKKEQQRVVLKRAELKRHYPTVGLRRSASTDLSVSGMGHHWVSPLPEPGHNYLRSMYAAE